VTCATTEEICARAPRCRPAEHAARLKARARVLRATVRVALSAGAAYDDSESSTAALAAPPTRARGGGGLSGDEAVEIQIRRWFPGVHLQVGEAPRGGRASARSRSLRERASFRRERGAIERVHPSIGTSADQNLGRARSRSRRARGAVFCRETTVRGAFFRGAKTSRGAVEGSIGTLSTTQKQLSSRFATRRRVTPVGNRRMADYRSLDVARCRDGHSRSCVCCVVRAIAPRAAAPHDGAPS